MTAGPSFEELAKFDAVVERGANTGRWGRSDEVGAPRLINRQSVLRAAQTIRTGETVSLSRSISPTGIGSGAPSAAALSVDVDDRGASERLTIACHGYEITHVDALSHHWSEFGPYNGFTVSAMFPTRDRAEHLDVSAWRGGLVTRGVLFDVPQFRGVDYVVEGAPVRPEELRQIQQAHGLSVFPGDAVVIYSGRDAFDRDRVEPWPGASDLKAGVHPSTIEFLRDVDAAVLVWDMLDDGPYDTRFTVHQAISSFGIAMVDNAELGELARACRRERRYEFHLTVAPLAVIGATGSAVNPIATL